MLTNFVSVKVFASPTDATLIQVCQHFYSTAMIYTMRLICWTLQLFRALVPHILAAPQGRYTVTGCKILGHSHISCDILHFCSSGRDYAREWPHRQVSYQHFAHTPKVVISLLYIRLACLYQMELTENLLENESSGKLCHSWWPLFDLACVFVP